jgi:ABC-type nitrate/sulfonate/bicarbonate transport system substrate-binding protein
MSEAATRRRIQVVPHFMRLHEWIALEERFFEAEGLEPELLPEVMHRVSSHGADAYFERPQDRPFLEAMEVANSACEWGSVCNAGAGMGKFVPDLYGVARYAIFARPDSGITRLAELQDVPVGVGLMAGSHFTTLRALEGVLTPGHIKIENVGGPGRRLLALRDGSVKVATLLDPELALAEVEGFVKLASGEFRTLFWVSAQIPGEVLGSYFKALRRADEALRSEPEKYMWLWERNLPPGLDAKGDFSNFGFGELLCFEPYPPQTFEETVAFARRWGLDRNMREDSFQAVAAPAIAV